PFASPTRRRVPQPTYRHNNSSLSRSLRNYQPITFDIVGYSMQGVSMRNVLYRSSSINTWMAGANDLVFASTGLRRINLRITWPGLEHFDWLRSVNVSGPITRAQLAYYIAQNFERFLEKAQYERSAIADWRIGRNGIRFEHLVLISLYNISGDSFQADIAVDPR
ncbi:hypothetical protein K435DRAFT_593601, partial [Dendrothele bispora CBS 962.96]